MAAESKGDDPPRATIVSGVPPEPLGRTGRFCRARHPQSRTETIVFKENLQPVIDEAFSLARLVGPEDEFLVGSTKCGTSIFSTETRALLMEGPFDDVAVETVNRAIFAVSVKEPDGSRRLLAGDEAPRQLLKVHSAGSGYRFRTAEGKSATLVPVAPAMPEPHRTTLPYPPQADVLSSACAIPPAAHAIPPTAQVVPPTAQVVPPTAHSLSAYDEAMARYIGIPGMQREQTWRDPIGRTGVFHLRWTSMGALLTRAFGGGFPVIREVFPQGLTVFGANDEYAYGAALRDRSGIYLSGVYSTETGSLLLECSFEFPPTVGELERLMANAKDLIEKG